MGTPEGLKETLTVAGEISEATRLRAISVIASDDGSLDEVPQEEVLAVLQLIAKAKGFNYPFTRKRELSPEQIKALLTTLKERFDNPPEHYERPQNIQWEEVKKALEANPVLMWSLQKMEESGGEVDVTKDEGDAFVFDDCSKESPSGRRNVVYDREAEELLLKLLGREESPDEECNGNAVDMAAEWNVKIQDEEEYRYLQTLGEFDPNTRSWLKTPPDTRETDYALDAYCYDGRVEIDQSAVSAHNGDGGFRCTLRIPKAA